MTTLSPNQGIVLQAGTDPANLPGAQVAWDATMENRLVQRYLSEADRTARNAAPNENEISALLAEDRLEIFNSVVWISAVTRGLFQFVRRATDATAVNNSTVLVSDATMTTVLPAVTGVYCWEDTIFVDGSSAGDIKIAYTWPGGGSAVKWGSTSGNAIGAAAGSGDVNTNVVTASGTTQSYGLNAVGSQTVIKIEGEIQLAGTGGSLVLQYAQAAADPTNMVVRTGTRRQVWRAS